MCGDDEGRALGDWKLLHLEAQAFIRIQPSHLPGSAVCLALLSHRHEVVDNPATDAGSSPCPAGICHDRGAP